MPRKPNYGLNKHRKEQDRKAKKEAKRKERQERRAEQPAGDDLAPGTEQPDTSTPPRTEGV